jgi:hypothetical protein
MGRQFKRGDKVQSIYCGLGVVVKVNPDPTVPYPVKVVFATPKEGIVPYYTRDGKYELNEESDKDITLRTKINTV